jgi:hypothetical protein
MIYKTQMQPQLESEILLGEMGSWMNCCDVAASHNEQFSKMLRTLF